ncbi:hypothetical protein BC332_06886 [Capsicum chinense]|nr:hypothetical protein BC332_06886 [Capsicum chinense]
MDITSYGTGQGPRSYVEVKIYSLKSDSWRCIDDCQGRLLANDFATWLDDQLNIISIDLANEKWAEVEQSCYFKRCGCLKLGVFEGDRSVFCNYEWTHVDIWAMKEYGVRESWTKMFTIMSPDCTFDHIYPPPILQSIEGAEDNEHEEEECLKRDDPNVNSPSVESWSKASALIVILESCLGQYLDLPEDNNACFQIKMVYDLLKRRFIYENKDKMDEAWAFKAISFLRKQVNYQEEVSCPRILRWLSAKTDRNAKFFDLFNPPKEAIVHLWLIPINRELKMPFFLTLWSVQTLMDPKVVDGIKMECFGATSITRKIILDGGLVAVDDGSRSSSGSCAAIWANNAPLTVFETKSHYDYDHIGCIDFSPDFATSS